MNECFPPHGILGIITLAFSGVFLVLIPLDMKFAGARTISYYYFLSLVLTLQLNKYLLNEERKEVISGHLQSRKRGGEGQWVELFGFQGCW